METLHISKDILDAVNQMIEEHPQLLLRIPHVRILVASARIAKAEMIHEHVVSESQAVHDHTVTHNMNGLRHNDALWRPDLLFNPLMSIEYVRRQVKTLKLLIIGPRSEAELLSAFAAGFNPENVSAIDLLSYSELVTLGDMHDMPYDDNTFDVIVAGWVLAYSADNQLAASEMLRVAKPGAHVAIGCVAEPWSMVSEKQIYEAVGGIMMTSDDPERPGKTKTVSRYFHTSQILRLFDKHIDSVILREDKHPSVLEERGNVITVFRLIA